MKINELLRRGIENTYTIQAIVFNPTDNPWLEQIPIFRNLCTCGVWKTIAIPYQARIPTLQLREKMYCYMSGVDRL